ncbi:hypothetical protein GF412_04595 [Candidatus Micrarchaeota archaeon]|nr:hypothetical protein [Candidatus Micrarchaeota archaeon]MBD3418231.1 hypothetical protein [Candidatus Micrarchaeota archaeon]
MAEEQNANEILRDSAYRIVNYGSHNRGISQSVKRLRGEGEKSLRLIIKLAEEKFEKGATDLPEEAQKKTLMACRDICIRHKISPGLLMRLENVVARMGSSFERTEVLYLIGEKLAAGDKKRIGRGPASKRGRCAGIAAARKINKRG